MRRTVFWVLFSMVTAAAMSEAEARKSMEMSLRWAKRSQDEFHRLNNPNALFGIVQGGMYKNLRQESLEALVAMAVMAFGMLAVMGVQSTLRFNGDLAKQRSEATRIAERRLEELRSFKDFDAWAGVAQALDQEVAFDDGLINTKYFVSTRVVAPVGTPQKVLNVTVKWKDRQGNDQQVVLGDTGILGLCSALHLVRRLYDESLSGGRGFWPCTQSC